MLRNKDVALQNCCVKVYESSWNSWKHGPFSGGSGVLCPRSPVDNQGRMNVKMPAKRGVRRSKELARSIRCPYGQPRKEAAESVTWKSRITSSGALCFRAQAYPEAQISEPYSHDNLSIS